MPLTYDEMQLIALYNRGSRTTTIRELKKMRRYLDADETELIMLSKNAIEKLNSISDTDYDALDLIPDLD